MVTENKNHIVKDSDFDNTKEDRDFDNIKVEEPIGAGADKSAAKENLRIPKTPFDILHYLVDNWLNSSYFLKLYHLYIDRKKDGIDEYRVEFILIRDSATINICNKFVNFTIYKFRRFLLFFVKTLCFILDMTIRLFVSFIMMTVVLSSLILVLSTLNIVDKQVIGCNIKVLKCP